MASNVINLASDNVTGAAPEILAALNEAATGAAMPYGNDPLTERVGQLANEIFEREVTAFPVATGTAANSLALSVLSPAYGVVFCHRSAHIEEDECGAPEFYTGGAKLTLLDGEDAKIKAADLDALLSVSSPASPVHHAQPAVVSITQATETGAVYSASEIEAIGEVARRHGISMHMDGARFANAVVASGASPADLTWRAGVDVLSFGATKNGAFAAELVVFFDKDKARDFEFRRKRGGHLFSKMRFLSAQLSAYLADDNWRRYATQANRTAHALAEGLRAVPGIEIQGAVEANMMFLSMPGAVITALHEEGCVFYSWGEQPDGRASARLVTAFDTSDQDIARLIAAARRGVEN
jgi:threonine aldolase